MKGIILSGGAGTRLYPLTKVTSKQLLPIYDRPMVFYPLHTLLDSGIKEILFIVSPDHCGDYMKVLGSGREFGPDIKFTYEIQDKPEGIAQAFLLAENFIDEEDNIALILGDNIFEENLSEKIKNFQSGALLFAAQVPDPERFGVVDFDENMKVRRIVEKPKEFISNYVQTGLYLYDNRVMEVARNLKPSPRGELEITDVNNWFVEKNELQVELVKGKWIDAGTFDSLHEANVLAYQQANKK